MSIDSPSFSIRFPFLTFSFKPAQPSKTLITITNRDGYLIAVKNPNEQTMPFSVRHPGRGSWEVENLKGEKVMVYDHWSFKSVESCVNEYSTDLLISLWCSLLSLLGSLIATGGKYFGRTPIDLKVGGIPVNFKAYIAATVISFIAFRYFFLKCQKESFHLANILISAVDCAIKNNEAFRYQELLLKPSEYSPSKSAVRV